MAERLEVMSKPRDDPIVEFSFNSLVQFKVKSLNLAERLEVMRKPRDDPANGEHRLQLTRVRVRALS